MHFRHCHAAVIYTAALILFTACSVFGSGGFELAVTHTQMDADFDEVLLLSTGRSIVGYDPLSLERKIRLDFNTYVTCGNIDTEGHLYLGDQGPKIGDFGSHLFVIDAKGRVVVTKKALPSPSFITYSGNYVIADSNIFFNNQCGGINFFHKQDMKPVLSDTGLSGLGSGNKPFEYDGSIYYGVIGNGDRKNRFYMYNSNDLTRTETEVFTDRHSKAMYTSAVEGHRLFIVFTFIQAVAVFDLNLHEELEYIDIHSAIPQLAQDPGYSTDPARGLPAYLLSTPVIHDGLLHLFAANGWVGSGEPLQAIVTIDTKTLKISQILDVEPDETALSSCDLRFVSNNTAFLYKTGVLYAVDLNDGSLRKTVDLSR